MVDSNFNESDLFMRIMILNSLYYPYRVGGAEISVQLLAEQLVIGVSPTQQHQNLKRPSGISLIVIILK